MSQSSLHAIYQVDNATRVTEALAGYLRGDIEPIVAICSPDVVWRSVASPEHAPFGGVHHGHAGVRTFFGLMFDAFTVDAYAVDVIPAGDEVIQVIELEVTSRDGTSHGHTRVVGRWRFKDGLAVSYTDYFDVAAAVQTSALDKTAAWANAVTSDPSFRAYGNENAVAVTEIFAEYHRGNIQPVFDILSPDIVWRSLAEPQHARFGGVYRGIDAVRTYFERLRDTYVLDEHRVVDVIPAGVETVHIVEIVAHRPSRPENKLRIRLVGFWTFEGGKATGYAEYFDTPSLLAQHD